MKKLTHLGLSLTVLGMLVLTAFAGFASGQDRGETKATIGNANISIEYGRPSLKGRDPLKMLEPGKLWRIGSNAPTTITSDVDLDFGGTRVAKGKHILLARLAEPGKWSLIVSTKNVFQYEPSAKLAEVPMELKQGEESVEQVTITLTNKDGRGVIEVAWGTLRLLASFALAK
jgi:nucleoid-associated protein YgaU